ncbi:MAG TPA: ThiF family adenylyltransferase [Gemmataceae bacterium]|jgi:sulfur carrier protein ThiS adenylyltransferase|nr:ThiF family adenylyltransferase [Gemmataceae bacterium]
MSSSSDSVLLGRDVRQHDLVPPARLAECHALVIGVGAVGRQVALQLAAIGMPKIHLFDDDTVQVENLAPQGYWPADLNSSKAEVTADLCRRIHPEIEVVAVAERFKRSTARALPSGRRLAVFLCVDSIQTRRLVWEAVSAHVAFLVDGRMSAEVLRVLATDNPAMDANYSTTLFQPEQAYAGSCTAKSTIYTANIAAGLMLAQFTRWLRRLPVDPDLTLNLLASELTTGTSR